MASAARTKSCSASSSRGKSDAERQAIQAFFNQTYGNGDAHAQDNKLAKTFSGGEMQKTSQLVQSGKVSDELPLKHCHRFIQGRAAEARSQRGLSSLDCLSCGGLLAKSDEVTCSYCGTALTGGKHE